MLNSSNETMTSPAQIMRLDAFRKEHSEWLIIVLDACRYDVLNRYLEDTETVEKVRSPALHSQEWARACWTGNFDDVTYITGNAFFSAFSKGKYRYNSEKHLGNVIHHAPSPPKTIRESVLTNKEEGKIVAHFMQPHRPYYPQQNEPENKNEVWKWYKRYRENLEFVWENGVAPLLKEFDRPTVITADHGEALAPLETTGREAADKWFHKPKSDFPEVRYVPWIGINTQNQQGTELPNVAEERLKDLGYL